MKKILIKNVVAAVVFATTGGALAGEIQSAVEQRVTDELERMVDLFESTKSMKFSAHAISEDVSSSLQKLQYDTSLEGAIQKPDKLYLKKTGAENAVLWFDGQTATILDIKANKYARIPIEGGAAGLIKKLDSLGVETPFAGLFHRSILKHVEEHVFKGDFYGESLIDGTKSNHIAMRQDAVDWQLWTVAATGAPKKVVITSKMIAAAPQHTLLIKQIVAEAVPDSVFQPSLPENAVEVPVQSEDVESVLQGSW